MANALWTFSTATTTGFEADVDTLSGVSMASLGDGSGADAVPVPTVPGETGNGRLLASANHYNAFSTQKVAALAHTSGNPINLSFQWRPLLDYAGVLAGAPMLTWRIQGFDGGGLGVYNIIPTIRSNATVGLYDLSVSVFGFYAAGVTVFTFTGFPLTLRDWNEIEVAYDGVDTIDFLVNGVSIGTIGPTDFPAVSTVTGNLVFDKDPAISGALYGVLDTVSLEIS